MKAIFSLLFLGFSTLLFSQAVKVEVRISESGRYQLYRNGEPYFIKGAGGNQYTDKAAEYGINSMRTWGIEDAKRILDDAQSKGLTIMLGFWMGHERHGFDYSDEMAVQDQLERFKLAVKEFKDHPALLLWGIGNEMELNYSNFALWDAVQQLAKAAHELDPNHPTCVVTAGIDAAKVQLISEICPDIDILGINTYGDLPQTPEKVVLFGWEKGYIITEWGPNGSWEVATTSWGTAIEQSSTEKAGVYTERYKNYIGGNTGNCMGSYIFLWGQKQEMTPTWYGLFVDGKETQIVGAMRELWSGVPQDKDDPFINEYKLNGLTKIQSLKVGRGSKVKVELKTGPENATYKWELLPESIYIGTGGDAERKPDPVSITMKSGPEGMYFKAPVSSGPYRLFVYIHSPNGRVAYDNFPFYVK